MEETWKPEIVRIIEMEHLQLGLRQIFCRSQCTEKL